MIKIRTDMIVVLGLVLGWIWATPAMGFTLEVGPKEQECFYEDAHPGIMINIQFQVLQGGLQDIDIKVRFPHSPSRYPCCPSLQAFSP